MIRSPVHQVDVSHTLRQASLPASNRSAAGPRTLDRPRPQPLRQLTRSKRVLRRVQTGQLDIPVVQYTFRLRPLSQLGTSSRTPSLTSPWKPEERERKQALKVCVCVCVTHV